MKSTVLLFVVAVLLFAAGALFWREARFTRSVAQSHLRLATLHYDAEDDATRGAGTLLNRLPWPIGSLGGDVERHKATVAYWLSRYQSLTDMAGGNASTQPNDPQMLLVAANAAYRTAAPRSTDPKSA